MTLALLLGALAFLLGALAFLLGALALLLGALVLLLGALVLPSRPLEYVRMTLKGRAVGVLDFQPIRTRPPAHHQSHARPPVHARHARRRGTAAPPGPELLLVGII